MFPNLRLLFLRFFILVQEINYSSHFIVYIEIKQIKNRCISLFRRLHTKSSLSRANSTSLRSRAFILCPLRPRTTRKICRQGRRKSVRSGWDWVVYGSFHKSLQTLFSKPSSPSKHSHCLANHSNSVVIGYPAHKLLNFLVNLLSRKEGRIFIYKQ